MKLGEIGLSGEKPPRSVEDAIFGRLIVGGDEENLTFKYLYSSVYRGRHSSLFIYLHCYYDSAELIKKADKEEFIAGFARWCDSGYPNNQRWYLERLWELDVTAVDLQWCIEEQLIISMQELLSGIRSQHAFSKAGGESAELLIEASLKLDDAHDFMNLPWGRPYEMVNANRKYKDGFGRIEEQESWAP